MQSTGDNVEHLESIIGLPSPLGNNPSQVMNNRSLMSISTDVTTRPTSAQSEASRVYESFQTPEQRQHVQRHLKSEESCASLQEPPQIASFGKGGSALPIPRGQRRLFSEHRNVISPTSIQSSKTGEFGASGIENTRPITSLGHREHTQSASKIPTLSSFSKFNRNMGSEDASSSTLSSFKSNSTKKASVSSAKGFDAMTASAAKNKEPSLRQTSFGGRHTPSMRGSPATLASPKVRGSPALFSSPSLRGSPATHASPSLRQDEVLRPYTVDGIEGASTFKLATPPIPPRNSKRVRSNQDWITGLSKGRDLVRDPNAKVKSNDTQDTASPKSFEVQQDNSLKNSEETSETEVQGLLGLGITSEIQIQLRETEAKAEKVKTVTDSNVDAVDRQSSELESNSPQNFQDTSSDLPPLQHSKSVSFTSTDLRDGVQEVTPTEDNEVPTGEAKADESGLGINFCTSVQSSSMLSPPSSSKEAVTRSIEPTDPSSTEVSLGKAKEETTTTPSTFTPAIKKAVTLPSFAELGIRVESFREGLGVAGGEFSVLAEAHASSPQSPLQESDGSGYNYEALFKSTDSPESLIDELLESNYRGQAALFTRASSVASIKSATSSARSTPSSSHSAKLILSELRQTSRSVSAPLYTPTTQPGKGESFAASQRKLSITPGNFSAADTPNKFLFQPYQESSGGRVSSPTGEAPASPHITYGHVFRLTPSRTYAPPLPKRRPQPVRGIYYFTKDERQAIADLVAESYKGCDKHENCTECLELEFVYYENKAMPTSMPPEERQKIINNNRSLRNIKNELESLLEHGAITDAAYDTIISSLPNEFSLNGPSRSVGPSPSPAPTAAFNNMSLQSNDNPPPAYNNPTPPALPGRKESFPPTKPELARAIGLYRYATPGDCNFEVGDEISVTDFTNNEWWFGRNMRTGVEGVFPTNYVQRQTNPSPPIGHYGGNEKAGVYGGGYPGQPTYAQQGPPPPGPSSPYNSSVPPMAIAEGSGEHKQPGKGQEMGKKFGKKLGNAAIFGAGATIGGNIVNSIF